MNDCESKVLMYIQYTFVGFALLLIRLLIQCFAFGGGGGVYYRLYKQFVGFTI